MCHKVATTTCKCLSFIFKMQFGHFEKSQNEQWCVTFNVYSSMTKIYMTKTTTQFTSQAVSPGVGRIWGNVPVLGSPSEICVRPCESEAKCPLPCESYGSFKLFKISASDFDTVSLCRRFRACAYEFLTTVTEGVVYGVHKVVIRSSFVVIRRHKVS